MRLLSAFLSILLNSHFAIFSKRSTPVGLEDSSKYPDLIGYLRTDRGWSDGDLRKLAGENFLRVFRAVEQVS